MATPSLTIPSHIEALVFDLDGTLADTMPIHLRAWHEAGKQQGVHITDEMILDRAGMPTAKVAVELNQAFGWHLDPARTKAGKDAAYARLKPQMGVPPIQAIYDLAQSYRGRLPMAVGTGSNRRSAEETLRLLDMTDWFQALVSADDVTHHKPEPETYLRCAELLGVAPEKCLAFEDAEYGFRSARAAGMEVIDVRPFY